MKPIERVRARQEAAHRRADEKLRLSLLAYENDRALRLMRAQMRAHVLGMKWGVPIGVLLALVMWWWVTKG